MLRYSWLVVLCLAGCSRERMSPQLAPVGSAVEPLAIDPYLLDVGEDRATVCWQTASERPSRLFHRSSRVDGATSVDTAAALQHRVRLEGLSPNAVYHYEVEGHRGSFRTLQAKRAVFVAIGHTYGTQQFDEYPASLLAAAVAEQNADFVVHTGDATWRALVADYRRFLFRPLHGVLANTPMFIAPGNHDAGWPFPGGVDLSAFKAVFPHEYPASIAADRRNAFYGVTKAGIRFTFLAYAADSGPESAQMQFLQRELLLPARFHVVAFGGAQTGYFDEPRLLRALREGGCALVLRGDGQQPRDVRVAGADMPMYVLGCGGSAPTALLRFEWSDPTLRVERLLPTGERQLIDELALVASKLVPRAGAARVARAALPGPSPVSMLDPGADPTAVAVLLRSRVRGQGDLAALGGELGVDGVVAHIGSDSAFDSRAGAITGGAQGSLERGPGWRAGRWGRIGVWSIHDASRAGDGQQLAAAALREFDGFGVAVVDDFLSADAELARSLGEVFDLVLSAKGAGPEPDRIGGARWIRFDAGSPQQLLLEAHATHLTIKLVGAQRSCHLLGWAYRSVPGIERHAIDVSQLQWTVNQDACTASLPMEGVRARGLGLRVRLTSAPNPLILSARCMPRGLPAQPPGHSQAFEGFRTDYFWISAADGEVLMPLTTSVDGLSVGEMGEVLLSMQSPATPGDVQFLELFWY
ncbi:MAG: metallophosphoesterase [Planctomycetota bacterium]